MQIFFKTIFVNNNEILFHYQSLDKHFCMIYLYISSSYMDQTRMFTNTNPSNLQEGNWHTYSRYRWTQNGKDFNPSGNDDRVAIQPGKGTLIFARPLEHDEGIYQCFAENEAGVASTVKVELRQASEC